MECGFVFFSFFLCFASLLFSHHGLDSARSAPKCRDCPLNIVASSLSLLFFFSPPTSRLWYSLLVAAAILVPASGPGPFACPGSNCDLAVKYSLPDQGLFLIVGESIDCVVGRADAAQLPHWRHHGRYKRRPRRCCFLKKH